MNLEIEIPLYTDDYIQKQNQEMKLFAMNSVYSSNCIRFELKLEKEKTDKLGAVIENKCNIVFLIDKEDLEPLIKLF